MRKKKVLLQLTHFISIIRSITYLDHTACHFFFSSKSMSKDMIIKMSCNEMAKEEKKSKFTCNVLMGMLRDWRGKCFFSQSNSHSRHIRWKKKQESEISTFFPTGRGNESCMQYTVDLILYFLIKIYKINIKSITS